jgi:hypothetical protein
MAPRNSNKRKAEDLLDEEHVASKKKAQPKGRKRLTKAEIMRRRTTFLSLLREIRQDILWKVCEYPELRSEEKLNAFQCFFGVNEKNVAFTKWAKKMGRMRKVIAEDMV